MLLRHWLVLGLMPVLVAAAPVGSPMQGPPPPGAEACMGCHVKGGGVGLLVGRPAADTQRMLEAYRSGRLPATLMNRIVKGYSEDEVIQLSLWFAGQ